VQERRPLVASLARRFAARKRLLIAAVAALVVAADQLSKTWIENRPPKQGLYAHHLFGTVWLWRSYNTGAAFGLGRGVTPVIETVAVILVVALLVFGRRAPHTARASVAVSLGLLVGGAIGNLADRVIRHNGGAVIDFIDAVRVGHHDWWPVFNVADSCIVVGAISLALTYSKQARVTVR
jgi:signal peptidase II